MEISTQFKAAGTRFASPERSSATEIWEQVGSVSRMDILCELLNAMPNLVMILNAHRQIIFGNAAVADFAVSQGCKCYFGLRPGELVSCRHALDAESGCGTGEVCKTCGAVLSILQALNGAAVKDECRILRVTGKGIEPLDMRAWSKPFRWNGQTYCLLILSDISNEKRRQVLERIFFHDVLNTAGNIWSIAELLNQDTIDSNDLKKDLATASAQLIDEINSQRQLLAAENNELEVNLATTSSIKILNSVAETYRNHEIATGKMIAVDLSSPDFEFETDETLLFRVLGNLLKNSLEASKSNQTVVMGCGQNDKEYFFWTKNSTVMPEEVKLQVFQRSYSTKGPGRGIGTYSIKLLTEKYLKGKVSFVSGPESTTFTITFPKSSK